MKCPTRCTTSRGYSMAPIHNFKIDKDSKREPPRNNAQLKMDKDKA
jgi:hypothetical protein